MSENFNNMNENFDNAVSGVERVTKKKGKKIAVISGITALVLVGGGVASYNLSDFVKNQVNLRVMKPEKYYAWVTEENSKELAQNAREKYQKSVDRVEKGQNMSVSLSYALNDNSKDYVLESLLGDDYRNATSDDEKVLIDVIDNMNNVALGGKGNLKDGLSSGSVFASVNGENIIDGDFAIDEENYDYFMRIPELSEQWLCMSLKNYLDDNISMLGIDIDEVAKNPYDYISPEELEDMIIRYTDVWNRTVEDIEIEKKEAVDICDITVDYTVVSVELTEKDVYELAVNLLEEVKDDSVIKRLCVDDFGVCTADEYDSELDDLITELDGMDADNDEAVTVNTYIDPNGDIRGLRMFMEDDMDMFCVFGKAGDNIRGEFYISEYGDKVMGMEFYADENGGKYSGSIEITDYDSYDYETDETTTETISLEFTDYEVVNEELGYVNAGINLIIPDTKPIGVTLSSDGKSQSISYNLNIEGTDYGTISLSMAVGDGADVNIPSKDGAFVIDYSDNIDVDFAEYIPQENMEKFIGDVLAKIGFDEELAKSGAEAFAGSLYGIDADWDTLDIDEDYFDDFDDAEWDTDDVEWDTDFDFDDEGWSEWQSIDDLPDTVDEEDDEPRMTFDFDWGDAEEVLAETKANDE